MDNRVESIVEILRQEYPKWKAPAKEFESGYKRTPYTILITTLISFQTKDTITLQSAKRLFELASTPQDMLKLNEDTVSKAIYPAGFYKKKAKSIIAVTQELIDKFNSDVPDSYEKLVSIKGIGPKTAKIVLERAYNQDVIAVDTHLHRVLNLLNIIDTKNVSESDKALEQIVPKKLRSGFNKLFVSFGQVVCRPNYPKCDECPISKYCPQSNT